MPATRFSAAFSLISTVLFKRDEHCNFPYPRNFDKWSIEIDRSVGIVHFLGVKYSISAFPTSDFSTFPVQRVTYARKTSSTSVRSPNIFRLPGRSYTCAINFCSWPLSEFCAVCTIYHKGAQYLHEMKNTCKMAECSNVRAHMSVCEIEEEKKGHIRTSKYQSCKRFLAPSGVYSYLHLSCEPQKGQLCRKKSRQRRSTEIWRKANDLDRPEATPRIQRSSQETSANCSSY